MLVSEPGLSLYPQKNALLWSLTNQFWASCPSCQRWQPFINLRYKHYWPSDITIMSPLTGANDARHWCWPHRDLRTCSERTKNHLGAERVFVFRLDSDRKSPHYFWKIRQGGWDPSTIYKQFFIQILLKHRFWISDYQFYHKDIDHEYSKGVQTKVKLFSSFVTELFYLLLEECLFLLYRKVVN